MLDWVGLWDWLGRDMPPRHLSREEEKEQEPKWGKGNLNCTRKDEIIMRNLGEEQVWENKGIATGVSANV